MRLIYEQHYVRIEETTIGPKYIISDLLPVLANAESQRGVANFQKYVKIACNHCEKFCMRGLDFSFKILNFRH